MSAKFTKGPWTVGIVGMHYNNPSMASIEVNYGNDGECICDTVYEESDAHLIAAAPEMYEMLEEIVSYAYANQLSKIDWDMIERAQDILEEARGGL